LQHQGEWISAWSGHRFVIPCRNKNLMDILILTAGWLCAIAFIVHFASTITVLARRPRTTSPAVAPDAAGVSILRPVCGVEFHRADPETTFRSSFRAMKLCSALPAPMTRSFPLRALIAGYPMSTHVC
jgi:hypothetical protein